MKKLVLLLLLVSSVFVVKSQAPAQVKYQLDTPIKKTLIQWVDDVSVGHIASGYAARVVKSQVQYVLPDSAKGNESSLAARRVLIPVANFHYLHKKDSKGEDYIDWKHPLTNVIGDYNYDPSTEKPIVDK